VNKTILIALPLFLLLNFLALAENTARFFDTASLLIVLGVAISFALCGSGGWFSVSRLSNAAEGAVIAGWLGALYGSVIILGNFDEQSIEWIGPACAVMALTVVYGYFIKALCRMLILAREADKS
jgi:ABC-type multidrug transport system permease subunit